MILKKHYITEEELGEYIALTTMLPGPSSTQTIISIGYKVGGPVLALLTMLVWALPVVVIMTVLSFLYQFLVEHQISTNVLKYIGPMAVGFIFVAGFKIAKKVVKGSLNIVLFLIALVATYFYRSFWVFPALLIGGGLITALISKEENKWQHVKIKPNYAYLLVFAILAIGAFVLTQVWHNQLLWLFERFFRYGYLIIGGGQVVVPYMYSDLVEVHHFMTSQEFLTGFGLVQGLPGPMFSFSAYAGGMAARGGTIIFQVAGAILSALGIFLPGVLLIFFVFPIWQRLKTIKAIQIALKGILAVAAGLILSAGLILMRDSGFRIDNIAVTLVTILLLFSKKVPSPILVVLVLLLGYLVTFL
jgi:chromate transporter